MESQGQDQPSIPQPIIPKGRHGEQRPQIYEMFPEVILPLEQSIQMHEGTVSQSRQHEESGQAGADRQNMQDAEDTTP